MVFLLYLYFCSFLYMLLKLQPLNRQGKSAFTILDKKIFRLVLPYKIVKAGFLIIGRHKAEEIIKGSLLFWNDWFTTAIIIRFIFYFITTKLLNGNKKYLPHLLLITIYIVTCIAFDRSIVWSNTGLCFLLGVYYLELKVRDRITMIPFIWFDFSLIVSLITAVLFSNVYKLTNLIHRNKLM